MAFQSLPLGSLALTQLRPCSNNYYGYRRKRLDHVVPASTVSVMTQVVIEPPIPPEEVAKRLGVLNKKGDPDRRRILAYAREETIPCVRLSQKTIRFYWSDIEKALRKQDS